MRRSLAMPMGKNVVAGPLANGRSALSALRPNHSFYRRFSCRSSWFQRSSSGSPRKLSGFVYFAWFAVVKMPGFFTAKYAKYAKMLCFEFR